MMQQNKEVPAVVPHIIDASKGSCLLAGWLPWKETNMAKTVLDPPIRGSSAGSAGC
jgi:hypothetical protein